MKNKRESGEVVVEASIIVTLVFIAITVMFCIGMVLYQRTTLSTLANRTATNIAQVYSNTLRDPFTGYIDPDNAYEEFTYSTIKSDAQLEAVREKGTAFVEYRLKRSQIIPATDRDVDVQIINKPNEMLKGQIVVTIKDTYNVSLMKFFGIDGGITVQATGRADCVDYLDYLQGVGAIAEPGQFVIDECVVTFMKDKYTGGFYAAQPVKRGMTFFSSYSYTNCKMPDNPTLNDMQFTGWVMDKDDREVVFSATTQVNENITVYASWNCTVTLDPTGGTVTPSKITTAYHKPMKLPTPTRPGFAFEGWYTKKDGGGTQYVSEVTEIPGNITLYAKWRCEHAKFTKTVEKAATCNVQGVWRLDCDTCDYYKFETGDKLEHIEGSQQIDLSPSCTTPGWYVINCTLCDAKLKEGEIAKNPKAHRFASNNVDYDTPVNEAATCTKDGYKGSECSRCNTRKGDKLPATGHKWDSGKITKEATCCVVGEKLFKCTNSGCTATRKEEIETIDHVWNGRCGTVHDISKNPVVIKSHRSDEYTHYKHSTKVECYVCSVCGEPYKGWSKIKDAKGVVISTGVICREHTWVDNNGVTHYKADDTSFSDNDNMKSKVKHGD